MAVTVLLCYAHQDKRMADRFKEHLSILKHNRHIITWDYSNIDPGDEWKKELGKHLDNAQMILLLVSASFLASHYCYTIEMQQAIKRHESKEARVIPILLRSVYWNEPPLDKLQPLPDSAKPISNWTPQDNGFTNVVEGIMKIIKRWNEQSLPGPLAERQHMIEKFAQLVEAVKTQMQPPPRATATANTRQQLSIFIPNETTLADLIAGWQALSQPSQQNEEPA